jgi:hypothetical protein
MNKLIIWGIVGVGTVAALLLGKKKPKPGDIEVKLSVQKVGKDVTADEVSRVMSQLGKKSGKARSKKVF